MSFEIQDCPLLSAAAQAAAVDQVQALAYLHAMAVVDELLQGTVLAAAVLAAAAVVSQPLDLPSVVTPLVLVEHSVALRQL